MDFLECLTMSRSRADVFASLFLNGPREWRPSELGRAADVPPQTAGRELEALVGMGVLQVRLIDGHRVYSVRRTSPLARELGQLVRQARGPVPAIREALGRLILPALAWVSRPPGRPDSASVVAELTVLTSAPRSVVQLQLVKVIPREARLQVMSAAEWMARLQRGEILARRLRRARKLWVLGSWAELVQLEGRSLELRRSMDAARADWREELSDEWDEDFDPFDVKERTG